MRVRDWVVYQVVNIVMLASFRWWWSWFVGVLVFPNVLGDSHGPFLLSPAAAGCPFKLRLDRRRLNLPTSLSTPSERSDNFRLSLDVA